MDERDSRGRFVKGHRQGRPQGSSAKTTKEARQLFNLIIGEELDHIKGSLETIRQQDPFKYMNVLIRLMAFYWPTKVDLSTQEEESPKWQIEIIYAKEEIERLEALRKELDEAEIDYHAT